MDVVIVESPAKAKTINKYLGADYKVIASFGHVRDLPAKDGSVRPDEDFDMSWEVNSRARKHLSEITKAVKDANRLILATDPDREGEAISWHVLQVLESKNVLKGKPIDRVVFNAVTKQAVENALAHPRQIDVPLVDAYLARRALDYLVGFTLSPVLWRKLPGARSAGRVQSVALRLVCDREAEIERFVPLEYWSVLAHLASPSGDKFQARIAAFEGEKLTRLSIGNEDLARKIAAHLDASQFAVTSVESKPQKRNPQPPFTTSTIQQEAQRKLGYDASRTMRVAQRLYEGIAVGSETVGLITYMRTDGIDIAPEALTATRAQIGTEYGERYLPAKPRQYRNKAKNAQEAHEAIRPTEISRTPADVVPFLDSEQAKLYELIWKRTISSQMASAEMERTTVDISAASGDTVAQLRATGTVIRFDGFLTVYQEGRDDEGDDEGGRLPKLASGDVLTRQKIETSQHFTEPPPRFTEASLIKRMEELGIGRPSTYAQTMQVLRDREYVRVDRKRLIPEDKGRLVTAFLESFFQRYVEYDFTADLEEKLDQISAGEIAWKDVLREFWKEFAANVDETKDLRVSNVLDALNEILGEFVFPDVDNGKDPRACPTCDDGQLSLKIGKYGAFIGCSNYPECRFTRQLAETNGDAEAASGLAADGKLLGLDPNSELPITLRTGRFGPYVQLGDGDKPKRTGIPKGWDPGEIDLEKAIQLLSLPREIGAHPETGKPITAGLGRYGPFVSHDGQYANLDSVEEVFTVGENRAVSLLAEKKSRGGRRAGPKALKELGDHPELGGAVTVREGRYGPYVNHGKVNATIPKTSTPESVTLEQAVEMIANKAKGNRGSRGGKSASSKSKADS